MREVGREIEQIPVIGEMIARPIRTARAIIGGAFTIAYQLPGRIAKEWIGRGLAQRFPGWMTTVSPTAGWRQMTPEQQARGQPIVDSMPQWVPEWMRQQIAAEQITRADNWSAPSVRQYAIDTYGEGPETNRALAEMSLMLLTPMHFQRQGVDRIMQGEQPLTVRTGNFSITEDLRPAAIDLGILPGTDRRWSVTDEALPGILEAIAGNPEAAAYLAYATSQGDTELEAAEELLNSGIPGQEDVVMELAWDVIMEPDNLVGVGAVKGVRQARFMQRALDDALLLERTPIDEVATSLLRGERGIRRLFARTPMSKQGKLVEETADLLGLTGSRVSGNDTFRLWHAMMNLAGEPDEAADAARLIEDMGWHQVLSAEEAGQQLGVTMPGRIKGLAPAGDVTISPLMSNRGKRASYFLRQMFTVDDEFNPMGLGTLLNEAEDTPAMLRLMADRMTGTASRLFPLQDAPGIIKLNNSIRGFFAKVMHMGLSPGYAVRNFVSNFIQGAVIDGVMSAQSGKAVDEYLKVFGMTPAAVTRGLGGGAPAEFLKPVIVEEGLSRFARWKKEIKQQWPAIWVSNKVEQAFGKNTTATGMQNLYSSFWRPGRLIPDVEVTELATEVTPQWADFVMGHLRNVQNTADIDNLKALVRVQAEANETWRIIPQQYIDDLRQMGKLEDVQKLLGAPDAGTYTVGTQALIDDFWARAEDLPGAIIPEGTIDAQFAALREKDFVEASEGIFRQRMNQRNIAQGQDWIKEARRRRVGRSNRSLFYIERSAQSDEFMVEWTSTRTMLDDRASTIMGEIDRRRAEVQNAILANRYSKAQRDALWQGYYTFRDTSWTTYHDFAMGQWDDLAARAEQTMPGLGPWSRAAMAEDIPSVRIEPAWSEDIEQGGLSLFATNWGDVNYALRDEADSIIAVADIHNVTDFDELADTDWIEIHNMAVREGQEGRGLGGALIRELQGKFRSIEAHEVLPDAEGFWQRMGFTYDADGEFWIWDRATAPLPPQAIDPMRAISQAVDDAHTPNPPEIADAAAVQFEALMRSLEGDVTGQWGQMGGQLTGDQLSYIDGWLDEYKPRLNTLRTAMVDVGTAVRDFAYLNYSDKRNIDTTLGLIWQYPFWYSRTYSNWIRRAVDQPHVVSAYFKLEDALHKVNAGLPEWWHDQIKVAEVMGDPVYIPLQQTFNPLYGMLDQFRSPERERVTVAGLPVGQAVQELGVYGPSTNVMLGFMLATIAWAQGDEDAARAWANYQSSWGRWMQAGTAVLREEVPETGAVIPPGGLAPEMMLPWMAQGVPVTEGPAQRLTGTVYQRQRVGRTLAELSASGEIPREDALLGAYHQTGDVWDRGLQAEEVQQFPKRTMGLLGGPGLTPRGAWEMELQTMYGVRNNLYDLRDDEGVSSDDYSQAWRDFKDRWPDYDIITMARETDPRERLETLTWSVLNRFAPGWERTEAFDKVGQERAKKLLSRFYDSKGQITEWTDTDLRHLEAIIVELAETQPMPTPEEEQLWDAARDARREVTGRVELLYGETWWEGEDAGAAYEMLETQTPDWARQFYERPPELWTSGDAAGAFYDYYFVNVPPGAFERGLKDAIPLLNAVRDYDTRQALEEEGFTVEQYKTVIAAVQDFIAANPDAVQGYPREWDLARHYNDWHWTELNRLFGEEIWDTQSAYFDQEDRAAKRQYLENHPELPYFWAFRDDFTLAFPIWAKYYRPDADPEGALGLDAFTMEELPLNMQMLAFQSGLLSPRQLMDAPQWTPRVREFAAGGGGAGAGTGRRYYSRFGGGRRGGGGFFPTISRPPRIFLEDISPWAGALRLDEEFRARGTPWVFRETPWTRSMRA